MNKLIKPLFKIDGLLMLIRARIKNYVRYKRGERKEDSYLLHKMFLSEKQRFGVVLFYQSYPPLNISGLRDTLSRYNHYGLDKILKKDMDVLDIGSNTGFFSIFIANKIRHIDLLEYNESLTKIASFLSKKEGKNNVKCICEDFKKFKPEKKYDLIFSFAVHGAIGIDLKEYLEKVKSYLKPNGMILIESHSLKWDENSDIALAIKKDSSFEILKKGTIDDHLGAIRQFFLVRKIGRK